MAIGNGYFNVTLNQLTQQIYGYFHGFLDDASWENFTKSCGGFEQLGKYKIQNRIKLNIFFRSLRSKNC